MDLNPGHEELDVRTRAHLPAIVLGFIQALPELPFPIDALTGSSRGPGMTDSGRGPHLGPRPSDIGDDVGCADRGAGVAAALAEFVDDVLGGEAAGGMGSVIWGHSLCVAAFVEVLGERLGSFDCGTAFTAALLHDMGRLVLHACLPRAYARVVESSEAHRTPLDCAERQQLGTDHAEVGRALARHWGLPLNMLAAIGGHHESVKRLYYRGPDEKLAAAIQLGERLNGQDERTGRSAEELDLLGEALEIRADELTDVLRRAQTRCEELGKGPFRRLFSDTPVEAEWESGAGRAERYGAGSRELVRRLRVVGDFVISATQCADACELCQAIMRCVGSALGVEPTAAFITDRRYGVYYCAVREGAGTRPVTFVTSEPIEVGSQSGACGHLVMPVGPTLRSSRRWVGLGTRKDIGPGESEEPLPSRSRLGCVQGRGSVLRALNQPGEKVFERFRRAFASEQALMLPLGGGERMPGGILFDVEVGRRVDEDASGISTLLMACLSSAVGNMAVRLADDEDRRELADHAERIEAGQAAVVQSRSLSAVACMAAGAAHELNTPLAVISGRAQFLEGTSDDPEVQRWARVIHEQSRRCSEIVDELLAFAKPASPRPERVCLREAVADVGESFPGLGATVERELVVELADPDVALWADRKQLQTAWRAIVANALEALGPKKGRLIINSASHSSDETVIVRTADSGRGMSPDVLEHAYDPFFSHRPAGRGRGLGLSMARRLIELNGGRLTIESTEKVGTVVTMELPARAPRGTRNF